MLKLSRTHTFHCKVSIPEQKLIRRDGCLTFCDFARFSKIIFKTKTDNRKKTFKITSIYTMTFREKISVHLSRYEIR